MKLFSFFMSEDLKKWALDYVARKQIRSSRNNPSVGELIRRLLEEERERDNEQKQI